MMTVILWKPLCVLLASSDPSGGGNLGPIVTREGKGKYHWIVLPVKCQADTDQSHLGY